jgi:hypothetical protein
MGRMWEKPGGTVVEFQLDSKGSWDLASREDAKSCGVTDVVELGLRHAYMGAGKWRT